MNRHWTYLFSGLILTAALVWLTVVTYPTQRLRIIACDVGQGDGLLIQKGRTQIIVDGGPGNKILSCLGRYMPFWDRKIEMVILTNPDRDHFYGLVEVVKRYDVDMFLANPTQKEGEDYKALVDVVVNKSIPIANPITGSSMKIGDINIDFVWPEQKAIADSYQANPETGVLGTVTSNKSVNELSLVFNLTFGEFDALFTGDIVPESLDEVLSTGRISDIEYLKVPHHGSKNGLTKELLDKAKPEVAVISLGKNNRYGHPHSEVLKLLEDKSIQTFRTDQIGDVIVETDGKQWWVK